MTTVRPAMLTCAALAIWAAGAQAQLEESQVLVIYDSDAPDSRLVAEYYAGSAKVPGGVGGRAGAYPGVRVVDLSSLASGGVNGPANTVSYAQFIANFRDPLRAHLTATDPTNEVRCLVTTRGLPHRVDDTDNANVGDRASDQLNEFNTSDATSASMESELSLLWQSLSTGEAGGVGDSRADNVILNPYHRSATPINAFSTFNIRSAKTLINAGAATGLIWTSNPVAPIAQQLTPGDIYLACRLDGNSVAAVQAMIDRARSVMIDTAGGLCVFDESGSEGVQDLDPTFMDQEFDNDGETIYNAGDDWEQSRDALLADGRFSAANILYDGDAGVNHFFVGPRLTFDGEGIVISGNVVMLSHQGRNHNGIPGTVAGGDQPAGARYAGSFHYATGAVFNSIESWNGRAFGGLGTQGGQEQAADFIDAGGTFATCNVWEPLSIAIPDSNFLTRNFLLGGMTWVEAAYSSFPFLSWQEMPIGDPLARAGGASMRGGRASEDIDGNGRVSIDDMYAYELAPIDLNHDVVVNAADRAILEAAIRSGETVMMGLRRR